MKKIKLALAVGLSATALVLVPLALARAQESPRKDEGQERLDMKRVGKRYRLKVVSAGVPTLGAFLEGYSLRTQYRVLDKQGKLVGTGYLNDYVYVEEPGEYAIEVNGGVVRDIFDIPPEMTRDRIEASWKRARAVELRPRNAKARLAVPSIWVLHPPEVVGEHVDDYTIEPTRPSDPATASASHASGVAVVYPPEEIHDIDDGVLFANTLVHLWPGKYVLRINGTSMPLELAAGETKLVRLGALIVHQKPPEGAEFEQQLLVDEPGIKGVMFSSPDWELGRWFVAAPGHYGEVTHEGNTNELEFRFHELCEVQAGGKGAVYALQRAFAKPRLGLNAQDQKGGGAIVRAVSDGGPAATAGVKVGDVIVKVDGKDVAKTSDLVGVVGAKKPGEEITLTVKRDGAAQPVELKVKLGGD